MRKLRFSYVGVVVAVVGTLAVSGLVAHAGNPVTHEEQSEFIPEVPAPRVGDTINEAEMEDIMFVSEQDGIPLDEAIARYGWHNNFSLVASQLRSAYPHDYSGAEIVGARKARISFKGAVPKDVDTIIGPFLNSFGDVNIELRPGQGHTEGEIEFAIAEIHLAIYQSPEVADATTSFDRKSGEIVTRVVLNEHQGVESISHLNLLARGVLEEISADEDIGLRTKVSLSDSRILGGVDSSSHHHGGELISSCTSGFGTRANSSTSGARGISTAGHCSNSQIDDSVSLTFKGAHEGMLGDFQWHTGPRTHSDDFYAGSASTLEVILRDVSSVGNPTVGQTLCKNGATTKRTCQQVRDASTCKSGMCFLVQMGRRDAAGGDSGGPVFWGNVAYGLHHGWHYDPGPPFDRDLFSRAALMPNALGVYVATN